MKTFTKSVKKILGKAAKKDPKMFNKITSNKSKVPLTGAPIRYKANKVVKSGKDMLDKAMKKLKK